MNNHVSVNIPDPEYVASYNPLDLNQGIQDYFKIASNAILYVSLFLVRIQTEKLFTHHGHKNMTSYIEKLAATLNVSRSNVFNWLRIGKIFLAFREELESRGFGQGEGVTKLPYLERALKNNPRKEVFDKLMTLNRRDFIAYARGVDTTGALSSKDEEEITALLNERFMNNQENDTEELSLEKKYTIQKQKMKNNNKETLWFFKNKSLYYKGGWVLSLNTRMPWNMLNMISRAIRVACNALDRKGAVLAVHLDTNEEMWRIQKPIIRLRDEMQSGTFKAEDNVLRFLR